ncbi:MAG: hypothetical protein AAF840_18480, partial [Bacteroidota bacterium]
MLRTFLTLLSILPLLLLAQAPEAPAPTYLVVSPTDPPPAANPGDGISLIMPPTASPMGGANLDFPIKLPPARKHHAPQLDL